MERCVKTSVGSNYNRLRLVSNLVSELLRGVEKKKIKLKIMLKVAEVSVFSGSRYKNAA